ncbi:MAG: VOC family protein [Nanoarchaeota archaeon]
MVKMNSVVHFEMPAKDMNRMMEFYSKVFGWKTNMLGDEMGNYVLATTTEIDEETSFPKKPGAINGGFYKKTDDATSNYPSVVIGVDDYKEAIKNIRVAGGEISGEPMEIPGFGTYVSFFDTEGNRVGMMQPNKNWKN